MFGRECAPRLRHTWLEKAAMCMAAASRKAQPHGVCSGSSTLSVARPQAMLDRPCAWPRRVPKGAGGRLRGGRRQDIERGQASHAMLDRPCAWLSRVPWGRGALNNKQLAYACLLAPLSCTDVHLGPLPLVAAPVARAWAVAASRPQGCCAAGAGLGAAAACPGRSTAWRSPAG